MVLQQNSVERTVAELLGPHIEREGFELVLVEFKQGTRSSLLRLLVDRAEGGVRLDDLERLSPVLGDLLDVYDPVAGRYTLEVASPGINRPLSKLEHFRAHLERRVKVRTHRAVEGRKSFIGKLAQVNEDGIELDDEVSGRRQGLKFSEIKAANYEHDFEQEFSARARN